MKFNLIFIKFLIFFKFHFLNCTNFAKRNPFIASGTKWCGSGNIASDCNDLGEDLDSDVCCREHDNCPFAYSGSDNHLGFKWTSILSTLSHCECDRIFHGCLEKGKSENSLYIKSMFFGGLKVKCFAYLPCNSNEIEQENIWIRNNLLRIGNCTNGIKVRVFDSIKDYSDYMDYYENTQGILDILIKKDELMHSRKKNFTCINNFTYLLDEIPNRFQNSFINSKNLKLSTYDVQSEIKDEIESENTPITMIETTNNPVYDIKEKDSLIKILNETISTTPLTASSDNLFYFEEEKEVPQSEPSTYTISLKSTTPFKTSIENETLTTSVIDKNINLQDLYINNYNNIIIPDSEKIISDVNFQIDNIKLVIIVISINLLFLFIFIFISMYLLPAKKQQEYLRL